MKILRAKFFQPIEIPTNREHNHEMAGSITNAAHDIELQGNLISITHRESGNRVFVTLVNTAYIRELHEPVVPKATPSPKGANKTKPVEA